MTTFIPTRSHGNINADRIVRTFDRSHTGPDGKKRWSTVLEYIDADGGRAEAIAINQEMRVGEVVPATPGYFAIGLQGGPEEPGAVWRTPIIAWRVENGRHAYPIDILGDSDIADSAILSPGGQVYEGDGSHWESVDAWMAEKFQTEEKRATQAEKAD